MKNEGGKRRWRAYTAFGALGALSVVQCVSDPTYLGSGPGDGAGDAGAESGGAPEPGSGGSSNPAAGRSGSGGSDGGASGASGARGGTAGRGGSAGRGGTGGASGGRAGGGTGGDSGQAGQCAPVEDPLAHCPEPPIGNDGSDCPFEATCEAIDCGKPWSVHDAQGCLRKQCTSSSECDDGERCLPGPVGGFFQDCFGGGTDDCSLTAECSCSCSFWEGCSQLSSCVSATEFPVGGDFECPVEDLDCEEVINAIQSIENYIASPNGGGALPIEGREGEDAAYQGDALSALERCRDKLFAAEASVCACAGADDGGPYTCHPDVSSGCSIAVTCELLECGKPWSFFDENGCKRQNQAGSSGCSSSDHCAASERCIAPPVAGSFGPVRGEFERCQGPSSCDCACSFHDDGTPVLAHCVPDADVPVANDCPLDGLDCAALEAARTSVSDYAAHDGAAGGAGGCGSESCPEAADLTGDTEQDLDACAAKIDAKILADCG